MTTERDIASHALEMIPDIAEVEQRITDDPEEYLARAFAGEDRSLLRRPRLAMAPAEDELGTRAADHDLRRRALGAGRAALRKVRTAGVAADLTPAERVGLEAVVLIEGRPAILFQDGGFLPPPRSWSQLEQHREQIESVARSVGRIEIDGHPSHEWVGTGFLVAPDIVMTNRHVAIEFARREDGSDAWIFEPGMTARIDYVEELSATTASEWAFQEVIGMHPERDIALLRVTPGADPPPPLPLLGGPPGDDLAGRQVYVIGYPTWDGRRNDPQVIQRIFTNIFDVKRLQPGLIGELQAPKRQFTHDASTLAGNSGSCVVDLDSGTVFGLHFRGKYLEANRAVALWMMTEDALIKPADLNFV